MDNIALEILEDGTITVKTEAISAGNHMSADQLLAQMEKLAGGAVARKKNPDQHNHAHLHNHAHSH